VDHRKRQAVRILISMHEIVEDGGVGVEEHQAFQHHGMPPPAMVQESQH
jgi:hypothetical protein